MIIRNGTHWNRLMKVNIIISTRTYRQLQRNSLKPSEPPDARIANTSRTAAIRMATESRV